MINPFVEINWKPNAQDLRRFGRAVFTGLLIMATIVLLLNVFMRKHSFTDALFLPSALFGCGLLIFFISYFIRNLAIPVYYIWFIAGASVGIIMSNFLLLLFYYLIFTPVGLFLRIFTRRDPLRLEKSHYHGSNWEIYKSTNSLKRYFKQY